MLSVSALDSAPVKKSIGQLPKTHYPWIGQDAPFFANVEQEMGDGSRSPRNVAKAVMAGAIHPSSAARMQIIDTGAIAIGKRRAKGKTNARQNGGLIYTQPRLLRVSRKCLCLNGSRSRLHWVAEVGKWNDCHSEPVARSYF